MIEKGFPGGVENNELSHVWKCMHDATIKENIGVFHELLKDIREWGIKPIILVMPFHHSFYERYSAETEQMKEVFYKLLTQEELCRDITVIDWFKNRVSYDDNYWADATHLNSTGADAFSVLLENELTRIYYETDEN